MSTIPELTIGFSLNSVSFSLLVEKNHSIPYKGPIGCVCCPFFSLDP